MLSLCCRRNKTHRHVRDQASVPSSWTSRVRSMHTTQAVTVCETTTTTVGLTFYSRLPSWPLRVAEDVLPARTEVLVVAVVIVTGALQSPTRDAGARERRRVAGGRAGGRGVLMTAQETVTAHRLRIRYGAICRRVRRSRLTGFTIMILQ